MEPDRPRAGRLLQRLRHLVGPGIHGAVRRPDDPARRALHMLEAAEVPDLGVAGRGQGAAARAGGDRAQEEKPAPSGRAWVRERRSLALVKLSFRAASQKTRNRKSLLSMPTSQPLTAPAVRPLTR